MEEVGALWCLVERGQHSRQEDSKRQGPGEGAWSPKKSKDAEGWVSLQGREQVAEALGPDHTGSRGLSRCLWLPCGRVEPLEFSKCPDLDNVTLWTLPWVRREPWGGIKRRGECLTWV